MKLRREDWEDYEGYVCEEGLSNEIWIPFPDGSFHHRYDGCMLAFDESPEMDDSMMYLLFLTRNEEQRDNHCVCSARAALAAHGV